MQVNWLSQTLVIRGDRWRELHERTSKDYFIFTYLKVFLIQFACAVKLTLRHILCLLSKVFCFPGRTSIEVRATESKQVARRPSDTRHSNLSIDADCECRNECNNKEP